MSDQPSAITSGRVQLVDISPEAFQHPWDTQAAEQLRKVRGFDTAVRKFVEFGFERVQKVINIASYVRVSERQLPKLHGMLKECCAVLDLPEPQLYVGQGDVNAYTFGSAQPFIVLQTGLLDLMSDEEVMAVIAHELGHIKCGHVLYKEMAQWISILAEIAGVVTLGIGEIVSMPLQAALTLWDRRSELSADRAALLVMQDVRPCISLLMRLAGGTSRFTAQLDPEVFLEQAKAYGEEMDRTNTDRFYRLVGSLSKGTHPFAVERAKALNDWVESREFERILAGDYKRNKTRVIGGTCSNCGTAVLPGFKFCQKRGAALDNR